MAVSPSTKIERRQRRIVWLLVAFCIDTFRPMLVPLAPVREGVPAPHVHLRGSGPAAVGATMPRRPIALDGFHVAPPARSEAASSRAFRAFQITHLAALAPRLGIRERHVVAAQPMAQERHAALGSATARAPPPTLA